MENRMSEVAKLLGVELEKEFEIVGFEPATYKLIKDGLFSCDDILAAYTLNGLLAGAYEIIKPLLTKEEKEYLESVLKYHKENVERIKKNCDNTGSFLSITLNRDGSWDGIELPYIKEKDDLQYKGLNIGKQYTLKDLGLFEGE